MTYRIGVMATNSAASAGVGKSTLAAQLSAVLQDDQFATVAIVPFAQELKRVVAWSSSLDCEQRTAWLYSELRSWGYTDANGYPAGLVAIAATGAATAIQTYWKPGATKQRRVLQEVGSVFRDTLCKDVWVKRWSAVKPQVNVVIADDVRYIEETLAIDLLIGVDGSKLALVSNGHESENALSSLLPDVVINVRWNVTEFDRLLDSVICRYRVATRPVRLAV